MRWLNVPGCVIKIYVAGKDLVKDVLDSTLREFWHRDEDLCEDFRILAYFMEILFRYADECSFDCMVIGMWLVILALISKSSIKHPQAVVPLFRNWNWCRC